MTWTTSLHMRNPYLIQGMTAVAALVLAVPLPSQSQMSTYRVRTARGGLVIATPTDSARFLPVLRNTFQAPSGQIVEFSTERGAVTGLVLQAGRVRNLLFRREEKRVP